MPNINDFHRLYRRIKTGVGSDGQPDRLSLDPVKFAVLRVLTHVTVENKTNGYEELRIGLRRGGRDYWLDQLLEVPEGELAVSRSDILLGEADVFFAELYEADAGDELIMTCVGWEQDLK